jgi:hypothetical protein
MYDKRGTCTSYISNKPSQTLIDTARASERERERERECFESKRAAQRTFSTNVVAMAAAYCFNYQIHFFPEVILLPNSRRRNKRSNFSLEKKRQEGGKKTTQHLTRKNENLFLKPAHKREGDAIRTPKAKPEFAKQKRKPLSNKKTNNT